MTGSRMFPFITCTWNPLGGQCLHKCTYCWAQALIAKHMMVKYKGEPKLIEKEMKRHFKPADFVFVCDMLDLFGDWVSDEIIQKIWMHAVQSRPTRFLFLTKNPMRYYEKGFVADNLFLGCTIESNRDVLLSFAPRQTLRLQVMCWLAISERQDNRFISIEPIIDFDLEGFELAILKSKPWAVAVGYDNYGNKLPEPPLAKTLELIDRLEKAGITVYRKTLREAWNGVSP